MKANRLDAGLYYIEIALTIEPESLVSGTLSEIFDLPLGLEFNSMPGRPPNPYRILNFKCKNRVNRGHFRFLYI